MANESTLVSWKRIRSVAREQRFTLWMFLIGIVVISLSMAFSIDASPGSTALFGVAIVSVAARIGMAFAVFRMTVAVGARVPILWAAATFLPYVIGPLVLLIANQRATTYLKQHGIKVGLMGAKVGPNPPPGFICQETQEVFS